MIPLANHLWQSTLFAAVAGLLTLVLRNSHARTRHAIWMTASLKFLLPFSFLVGLGTHIEWRTAPAVEQPAIPIVAAHRTKRHPVSPSRSATAPSPAIDPWPPIVLTLWLGGCVVVTCSWIMRLRRIRSAVRSASTTHINVPIPAPIQIMSSPELLEPGVFGIFRPVLLLPEGIADRLTPAQLDAVLAHELCHVRRHDNLAAAIHMLVEALFWFHPLVWWIGARLVEERERACDEEVLRLGSDPQVYAESILRVCQFYLEPRIACVSGITGADLKKRIEDIMARGVAHNLGLARKLLLTTIAIAAVVGPIALGLLNAPRIHAQSPTSATAALQFEVASIKPSNSGSRGFSAQHDVGRFTASNASLQNLIEMAYQVKNLQISGAPAWLNSERFDIVAKAPPNTPRSQILSMLGPLLVDRFKLATHRETKVLPGYGLVIAKNGPKLHESTADHGSTNGTRGSLTAQRTTMAQLADTLARRLDGPVADMTGIQGFFDFKLEWAPDESQPMKKPGEGGEGIAATASTDGPTIFTALQEAARAEMEARRVPVRNPGDSDFHVEKVPTEN